MNRATKFGYILATITNVIGQYTLVSPDGLKDVWCPNVCFNSENELEINHCCACEGIPDYMMQSNVTNVTNVFVEILDVKRTESMLITNITLIEGYGQHQLIYTKQRLRAFPKNLCNYRLIKVDVSHNLFTTIGNISCLLELDYLVMAYNQITTISNTTFDSLPKLRYVDLSYNWIRSMDINVFYISNIFTFNMDGNDLFELDISNMLKINKIACRTSYSNLKNRLQMTNIKNHQLTPDKKNIICQDSILSNVTVSEQPYLMISKEIDFLKISEYVPCGKVEQHGSAYTCDCTLAEYFHLALDDVYRLFRKGLTEQYCERPDSLANIRLFDVYHNETLSDLMTCDVVDYCPKNGDCKCTCTSQPSKRILIVDCSNQSCTDFPEVVPETRHNIILNMSNNKIYTIHTGRPYFLKVKVLDLTGNLIKKIEEDISSLIKATDIILTDHSLINLPKTIKLLDPNVFHFGSNGISCTCDNRWIGEWRLIKKASKQYPHALMCSNINGLLFEDELSHVLECEMKKKDLTLIFVISGMMLLFVTLIILGFCFRHDILIARRLMQSKTQRNENWDTDVYISFEDSNEEIRSFVLKELDQFLKANNLSTYISCRDAWFGASEEENVMTYMNKSKYVLILQTKGMYKTLDLSKTKRLEFELAWGSMMRRKIAKVYVVKFDKGMEKFMSSESKALKRCGLSLNICERKISFYEQLLKVFNDPINENLKHPFRKQIQKRIYLQSTAFNVNIDRNVLPRVS